MFPPANKRQGIFLDICKLAAHLSIYLCFLYFFKLYMLAREAGKVYRKNVEKQSF